jgi:membrane peptidoglycan carboxypeptidase
MHPAMQRRRRQLLTRRGARRGSQRRGLILAAIVVFSFFGVLIGGTVLGAGAGAFLAYNYFASGLPDPHLLDDVPLPQSSLVYDRTGNVLLARFECQNRESVRFDQIPDVIVDATVASEDQTFWTNSGVDFQAIARAAYANLQAGGIVQGASTITQQVIKYAGSIVVNQGAIDDEIALPSLGPELDGSVELTQDEVCPPPRLTFLEGRGFEDKIREQIMAMQVTAAYPGREGKELILATYLNLIFYGNGSYGIKAAAANYFGIENLDELTLAQAAFLAALPQRPSALDPYQNPDGPADAMRERDGVLFRMLEEEYITLEDYQAAIDTTWEQMMPARIVHPLLEPHFTFRVQRELVRILSAMGIPDPEQAARTGGYEVITTLDYPLQQVARSEVQRWVAALADKNVHNGALVAIDSATGEIVAYIGSIDYYLQDAFVDGQFDVAGLAKRQPGSAFKPIVYTSAFQARQATVSTMFVDALTNFSSGGGVYEPTNADIREHGPVLAMDALRYSLNIPSVQMQGLVTPEVTARFAEALGIASYDYIMAQDPGLTLGLGTVPVNLTNFTQAYTAFAQQGTLHPATAIIEIRDREGEVVYSRVADGPETTQPMTPAEAYLTHWIIEGNTNPATNLLWGPRAQLFDPAGNRRHAGFKTGTTDDFKDVSGMGYIPGSLTVGVWMGNSYGQPMSNVLGQGLFSADGPLYLWHDFMDRAVNEPWDWNNHAPVPNQDFPMPAGVQMATVCRFSGMSPPGCGSSTISVPMLEGTVPPQDNVHHADQWHPGGCFDIVQYVSQAGRPTNWVNAAAAWADKVNNGRGATSGSRYAVSPLYGNGGFGGPFCGIVRATPTPQPTPQPSRTCIFPPPPFPCPGGGGGGNGDSTVPTAGGGTPIDAGLLVPAFAVPIVVGAAPYALRLARRRRH